MAMMAKLETEGCAPKIPFDFAEAEAENQSGEVESAVGREAGCPVAVSQLK